MKSQDNLHEILTGLLWRLAIPDRKLFTILPAELTASYSDVEGWSEACLKPGAATRGHL